MWQSIDKWDFITDGTLIYIEKTSDGNKVLGTDGIMVIPEVRNREEKVHVMADFLHFEISPSAISFVQCGPSESWVGLG